MFGANLIAEMLFGSIGFVAFVFGKRMQRWIAMFAGLALMIYPYFVEDALTSFALGIVGTAAIFIRRR